jgi:hypothetical protein
MPKTKISEFSATPANNTDIDSINIAEGCAPSGINDAIRELMAQLKDFQTGAVGDSFNGPIGTSTAAAGAFTTLAASGSVTLSGGTANGVTYLNGSKVLTSGSNFTYSNGLTVNGITQAYNTSLYTVDGTLSNYSATNGVYLDGNAAGWLNLAGDGTNATFVRIYGASYGTPNIIQFNTASSEKMRLDASGNLGIGTSSPTQKLDVYGNGMKVNNASYVGYLGAGNTFASGAASDFCIRSDNVLSFASNGPYERARFLTSGQLLVGTTTNLGGSSIQSFNGIDARATDNYNSNGNITFFTAVDTTGGIYCDFRKSDTARVGSITRAGTSSVAYNTTSDYRLKTVTGAVTGQGARIDALKPIDYLWKEGNSQARGFLAHEFQTVYPNSVTGDKDALDADGKPKYQVMQASTSEVIADLVAEIQSLRVRVAQLETN